MKKSAIICMIVATALILAGSTLFVGTMCALGWDFGRLATSEYEAVTHEITDPFDKIAYEGDTADVTFALSEDGVCRVECRQRVDIPFTVSVEDGTLTVKALDNRRWYEHIGFDFGTTWVTVYLPQGVCPDLTMRLSTGDVEISQGLTFGDVDIKASTGDVTFRAQTCGDVIIKVSTGDVSLSSVTPGNVDIQVSTGDISLSDVTCDSLTAEGDSSDLTLTRVNVAQRLWVKLDTGDVTLSGVDAGEIYIETDTGDVEGTLLSEKIFHVTTDTGDVDVPQGTTGGMCEITTDTGDVRIRISN